MFKTSDTKQLEITMVVITLLILLLIPFTFMLQWAGVMEYFAITTAEVVVTLGATFLCIFIVMYLSKKENRHFTFLDLALILFAISTVLSTLFAKDVSLAISGNDFTFEGTIICLAYLVILLSCSMVKTKKYRLIFYYGITAFGLFETYVAFMQTVMMDPFWVGDMPIPENGLIRAYGTIMNQDTFGSLMIMFAGLEYGLVYTAKKNSMRALHAVLAIFYTFSVIASGTRGAWIGLATSCFIFTIVIIVSMIKKKTSVKAGIIKLVGIIAMILLMYVAVNSLSGGVASETTNRSETMSEGITTQFDKLNAMTSGRLGIWDGAFRSFVSTHPILGVGVSNFKLTKYYDGYVGYAYVAHNEYIEMLSSQGIVGLATYLLLELYILIMAIKKMKKDGIENCGEMLGLLMAYTAYMIADLFEFRMIYLTPYFFALTGFMICRTDLKEFKLRLK